MPQLPAALSRSVAASSVRRSPVAVVFAAVLILLAAAGAAAYVAWLGQQTGATARTFGLALLVSLLLALPALGVMARDLGAASANQRQLIVAVTTAGVPTGRLNWLVSTATLAGAHFSPCFARPLLPAAEPAWHAPPAVRAMPADLAPAVAAAWPAGRATPRPDVSRGGASEAVDVSGASCWNGAACGWRPAAPR